MADAARHGLDTSRRRTRAKAELQRRARDLRPEEVDAILDEVWTAEGLDPPSTAIRGVLVHEALHPPGLAEKLGQTADAVEGVGRWVGGIVRLLRTATESARTMGATERRYYQVPTTKNMGEIEAELDPDAGDRLDAVGEFPFVRLRAFGGGLVELRSGTDGAIAVFTYRRISSETSGRLGVLRGDDAVPYRRGVAAAERVGQTATVMAWRVATPDRGQRLFVGEPLTRNHQQ